MPGIQVKHWLAGIGLGGKLCMGGGPGVEKATGSGEEEDDIQRAPWKTMAECHPGA